MVRSFSLRRWLIFSQCLILVDYYSALFFTSIGKIHPEEFCGKVGLCETSSVSIAKKDEKCSLCHQVVVDLLLKLKNPDAQVITQTILLSFLNLIVDLFLLLNTYFAVW